MSVDEYVLKKKHVLICIDTDRMRLLIENVHAVPDIHGQQIVIEMKNVNRYILIVVVITDMEVNGVIQKNNVYVKVDML